MSGWWRFVPSNFLRASIPVAVLVLGLTLRPAFGGDEICEKPGLVYLRGLPNSYGLRPDGTCSGYVADEHSGGQFEIFGFSYNADCRPTKHIIVDLPKNAKGTVTVCARKLRGASYCYTEEAKSKPLEIDKEALLDVDLSQLSVRALSPSGDYFVPWIRCEPNQAADQLVVALQTKTTPLNPVVTSGSLNLKCDRRRTNPSFVNCLVEKATQITAGRWHVSGQVEGDQKETDPVIVQVPEK